MPSNRSSILSRTVLPAVALALLLAAGFYLTQETPASAAGPQDDSVLAEVGSVAISLSEVETELASELQRLERERHEMVERGMEAAIERELINLEAVARGATREEVLNGIYSDVPEPTAEAVDAFYESRKSRINRPKEEVEDQIVNYLRQQERQGAYDTLLKELRQRYAVRRYLEPMRTQVAAGDGPAVGPEAAPVTIVEFSDFQCPYCQRLAPTLDRIVEAYGDQVRLVFRQFPLPIHADAQKAAEASLCAAEVGKFWEMHDAMFADIGALSVDGLKQSAAALELDAESFSACLDSGKYAAQVASDLQVGREAGVTGTPALFINGRFVSGAVPYDQIATVIDDELERESRQ